jgi:hypothetical protein
MSFSYNESQISASGTNYISMVRFQVDDTDSTTYILSDELITALYNETASTVPQIWRNYTTAIGAAEFIYRRYSKMPISWSSAGTSVNRSDRLTALDSLLSRLRMLLFQSSGASPILYADRPTDFQRCW